MKCPDCNGSGDYVGLGHYERQDCQLCSGSGEIDSGVAALLKEVEDANRKAVEDQLEETRQRLADAADAVGDMAERAAETVKQAADFHSQIPTPENRRFVDTLPQGLGQFGRATRIEKLAALHTSSRLEPNASGDLVFHVSDMHWQKFLPAQLVLSSPVPWIFGIVGVYFQGMCLFPVQRHHDPIPLEFIRAPIPVECIKILEPWGQDVRVEIARVDHLYTDAHRGDAFTLYGRLDGEAEE